MGTYINKGNEGYSIGKEPSLNNPYSVIELAEYTGDNLLVGINHDKDGAEGKKHICKIERYTKE